MQEEQTGQDALIERLRAYLHAETEVREVSMFGGRAFLVREKMVVSAQRDGNLLVRVASADHDELLAHEGAGPSRMGKDRDMGPGWITVAAASIADDERLAWWVHAAMSHNRALTAPGQSG